MMAARETARWRGELRFDEPMAEHCSWRAGGRARRYYRPADLDDLCCFLADLEPREPLLWLGLGSNLLVRDGGFAGTAIATLGALNELEWLDAETLRAGSGVTCSKVARLTAQAGLVGAEFLAGIPGTLGGALAMNAGAFGGETWERVAVVETVNREGRVNTRLPADYHIGYRSVQGPPGEWFVAAHLRLEPGDAQAAQARIRALLLRRGETQPTREPSCGSTFRNPPGDFAARLIEAAGLKGAVIGGARVSGKHANFIINTGGATAADIEELIRFIQDRVERASGVRLETEVRIVGEEATSWQP
jgi:UDP-N-acetylmuramate dehydrogenase